MKIYLPLLLGSLCLAPLAGAQDASRPAAPPPAAEPEPQLSTDRWRESAYGISFQPPARSQKVENTAKGALVQFVWGEGTAVDFYIRQNPDAELELATLKQQTEVEVTYGSRQALVIDSVPLRPAGRPGMLTYFDVERNPNLFEKRHGEHWVFGQALMKIDPHTVAVFQLQCPIPSFPESRKLFEAMLDSVEVAAPEELDRIRTAWITAGKRWYDGVDRAAMLAAMTHDQWFRVMEGDKDVGYMRIRHALGESFNLPGIRVDVQSRIISGTDAFDTESFFFVSDDRTTEVWSVRTGQRPVQKSENLPGAVMLAPPQLYEETGLRSGDAITVTRQLPGNVKDLSWKMPPVGYMSQAELYLLPVLFPRDQQRDFAFYAYNSATANIALRQFGIFPLEGGAYLIRERPSPEQGEQVSTYDANGKLKRREMPDHRAYIPATVEEIKRVWGVR